MAGECDKPKKDDPPIKGSPKSDKRKGEKGKAKGKPGDSGKGKPQLNKVEAETAGADERELKKQDSNPKELEDELGKQMEESTKNKYELFLDQLVSKGTIKYTEDISDSEDEDLTSYKNRNIKMINNLPNNNSVPNKIIKKTKKETKKNETSKDNNSESSKKYKS
jgi:hypothetical protein